MASVESVEEAFVRCHELERRMPGDGRWPFAGDAPWHLMQRSHAEGDYGGDGQDGVSASAAPRPPLDAGEVGEHDRVIAWLQLVPDEVDRRIVWLGTSRLAAGEGRVPWTALGRWLKLDRSPDTLARRYRLALALVACRINGWPLRKARVMAA